MDIRTAVTHANALMEIHGLKQRGWRLVLDNAKTRAGQTQYSTKTISLSRPMTKARDAQTVRNTILHEIAHALTPGHGHDRVWRAQHIALGGTGERCTSGESVKGRYEGTCPNGHKRYRHRLSKAITAGASCGVCNPHKFDERYRLVWVDTALATR